MISLKTILENSGSENHCLINEHGLSFFISTNNKNYLFDCSGSDNFLKNAEKMNIPLDSVETVICSHSHYDHSGGFIPLVKEYKIKKLITGKGFFNEKYAFDGIKYTYLGCGFDKKFLSKNNIEHIKCNDFLKLEDNFYVVGNFERKYEFEKIQDRFVIKKEDNFVKDNFSDEISLVILGEKGISVVTGCSHPGILNILSSIKKTFNKDIYAVYGGTHLVEADEERCIKTLDEMKKLGVKVLGVSHCSGELVINLSKQREDFISCKLSCGDEVIIL